MESFKTHVHVAMVAPLPSDYHTARALLSHVNPEYQLTSSRAACTVGKVGPHHTVLVGNAGDNVDIALFVEEAVADLLAEFPAIRAGFLLGVDPVAPIRSFANIGDIVVGIPQGFEPGLVQFDLDKTCASLTATRQMVRPPSCVVSAIHGSKSSSGRENWAQYLKAQQSRALSPLSRATGHESNSASSTARVLYGKIASTTCSISSPEMYDKVRKENNILCFERAAANLTAQLPFLTVCAVTRHSNFLQVQTHASNGVSIFAVIYALFTINNINVPELAKQQSFTNLHVYERFALDRPGFRLIRLEKGSESPLECHVFQAYLDDEATIIPYKALSYVWGEQDTPCEVRVNGKTMFITQSLHDALNHLRQPYEDEVLWVDALCIDQSDIRERGHQVSHMGEIYRKADKVIIWLGFFSGDAARLKDSVDDFNRQISSSSFPKWPREDVRWKELWKRVPGVTEPRSHERNVSGLESFMRSSWFTRVWILQEVANAKAAVIKCNLGSVPAKVFALLPYILDVKISQQCLAILDIMPGPSKLKSWWNENRSLGMLLCKFKDCRATDPRDKVFALLGMASDIQNSRIQVDYSISEDILAENICEYIFGKRHPTIPPDTDAIFSKEPSTAITEIRTIQELQLMLPRISSKLLVERLNSPIKTNKLLRFLNRQGIIGIIGDESKFKILLHGNTAMGQFLEKSESRFSTPFGRSLDFTRKQPLTFEALVKNHLVSCGIKAVIDEVMDYSPDHLDHVLEILQHPFELEEDIVLTETREYSFELEEHAALTNSKRDGHRRIRDPVALEVLLKYCNHPINITRNLVHYATIAGIGHLKIIFPSWCSEMVVSEFMTWQAMQAGHEALGSLINGSSNKIQLTDVVLRCTKGVVKSVSASVKSLIRTIHMRERNVSEVEAIQAILRGPDDLLALLNKPKTNFKITDRIREVALQKTYACDILSNRRYTEMWPSVENRPGRYSSTVYLTWPLGSQGQIAVESRHEEQYNLEHRHERRAMAEEAL
ncbi:hypothetical protein FGRMN_10150 [Fusarium graminum]|nr:hypothetical protein FGRMN_10150 [Fusarium graminum]